MADTSRPGGAEIDAALCGPLQTEAIWGMDPRLLNLLPVAVYFCDASGLLLNWNRAAEELWGRRPRVGDPGERFCGSHKLYQPDGQYLPHVECPMAEALRTGEPQRIEQVVIERPDGSRRFISVSIDPIRDDSGTLIGAVNVFQDITEKCEAERARYQVEKRFLSLLEKLPAAAYTCDKNGLITYFNERAVELWGRAPKIHDRVDQFCGSFRLFTPDGTPILHEECWMALALRHEQDYRGEEIVVEREDGTRRTALAYATPFHSDEGQLVGAVNVLVDITERKIAQDRIRTLLTREQEQSERLRQADRRKDEFLAMLAHELRNPLAPIRSGLDLLAIGGDDIQEVVPLMQEQVDHLVRLVDDLLDVSRIMRGKITLRKETIDLPTVIERSLDAVRPLVASRRQRLDVSVTNQPVLLDADPVRVVQIVSNLLNNAAKYTDDGGHLELFAEHADGRAVITIRDSGVGIDTDLLPEVFELFTQSSRSLDRANGGLGIGLTLVKKLVELHGGTVSAQSDGAGQGSSFCVKLPARLGEAVTREVPQAPENGRPHRILVVDDNRGAAWLLSKLLTRLASHDVEMAHDGPSALARVKEWRPEIVLLDIGLPQMDGFEVGRAIREMPDFDDLLLVALTGYGQKEHRQKSKAAGFDLHLVKPPSLDQMKMVLAHPKLTGVVR
ncbi:Autoinducer 2 sensor kinase/phosphatase LuxQ [Maioricimonas rarisocia]|uniref:histidine kinase n=1 Tax=Maioricimonas rarisocia TaxID=2528026 RepID=A0A517Z6L3_9PLAN|nr:PAS domain-containing sensor histidine kinase [Maioricimonas rarisocia]QDU38117.1 Autoinducer 2 sensor kinase/phosphatase LuxQ [Maioricimonas rarisocia]